MKNYTLPLLAVLSAITTGSVYAAVYKTVDAAGNAVYSDSPSKNSKEVNLPPLTIVPSIAVDANQPPPTAPARRMQYQINFLSPLEDQVVRKPDAVDVSVDVKPALAQGDTLTLLWDNQPVSNSNTANINTEEVDRGAHQLTARISSARGQILNEKSINVNVQQGSVNSPANQAKQPKPGKK